jgi:hypothetical protein
LTRPSVTRRARPPHSKFFFNLLKANIKKNDGFSKNKTSKAAAISHPITTCTMIPPSTPTEEHVTSMPVDSSLFQFQTLDALQWAIQQFTEIFLHSPFANDTLLRLSILLLVVERMQGTFQDTMTMAPHTQLQSRFLDQGMDVLPGGDPLLGLVVMTLFSLFLVRRSVSSAYDDSSPVSSSAWALNQELVVVTSVLFSFICLESFLPLLACGVTSQMCYRSICWETSLSILVVVWLIGALSSHV